MSTLDVAPPSKPSCLITSSRARWGSRQTKELSAPFASSTDSQFGKLPTRLMAMYHDARALLKPYLSVLAAKGTHENLLPAKSFGGSFLPRQTWIDADVGAASASERVQLRAVMEVVSRLSQSADFQWQRYYHSF